MPVVDVKKSLVLIMLIGLFVIPVNAWDHGGNRGGSNFNFDDAVIIEGMIASGAEYAIDNFDDVETLYDYLLNTVDAFCDVTGVDQMLADLYTGARLVYDETGKLAYQVLMDLTFVDEIAEYVNDLYDTGENNAESDGSIAIPNDGGLYTVYNSQTLTGSLPITFYCDFYNNGIVSKCLIAKLDGPATGIEIQMYYNGSGTITHHLQISTAEITKVTYQYTGGANQSGLFKFYNYSTLKEQKTYSKCSGVSVQGIAVIGVVYGNPNIVDNPNYSWADTYYNAYGADKPVVTIPLREVPSTTPGAKLIDGKYYVPEYDVYSVDNRDLYDVITTIPNPVLPADPNKTYTQDETNNLFAPILAPFTNFAGSIVGTAPNVALGIPGTGLKGLLAALALLIAAITALASDLPSLFAWIPTSAQGYIATAITISLLAAVYKVLRG